MKSKIKVRTSWGMTNSDCVLEQEISVNGESVLELIYELDCELFKDYPDDVSMIHREFFLESFSNPELLNQLYDELVFYIGQIDYFDLIIGEDLKLHLNETQLHSHELGNDYDYGESVFQTRYDENKGVKNWSFPWLNYDNEYQHSLPTHLYPTIGDNLTSIKKNIN